MGAREAAKFVRQYTPAMQQLYGNSSKELLAMQDYGKMLEILSRNKNVSYSGGSTSIEKLFMAAPEGSLAKRITKELATALAGGTAGFMTAGPIGGVVGVGAGTVIKEAAKMQKETMMNILREAITNPEAADLLMDIAKKRIKPASINNRLQTVLGYSAFKESANGE